MMEDLKWKTAQVRWVDMVPYDKNARKIKEANKRSLDESLSEFDIVEIPILDDDLVIIGGHQRRARMIAHGRGEELTDVRMPNRKLSESEFKKLNLLLNSDKFKGEFDAKMLNEFFSEFDLKNDFDIEMPDFDVEDLKAEMPNDEPEMPIVPKYSEKYSAVVIVIENSIDENFVREVLGLAKAQDYKTSNVAESYVMNATQFIKKWNSR